MVNDTGAVSVLYNCEVNTAKVILWIYFKRQTRNYISDSCVNIIITDIGNYFYVFP